MLPEEIIGDAPAGENYTEPGMDEFGNPITDGDYGWAEMSVKTLPEIQEDMFLTIRSVDGARRYTYTIYRINDYGTTLTLPIGEYYIEDAGIFNDYSSKYPCNYEGTFKIEKMASTIVRYTIGKQADLDAAWGSSEIIEETTPTEQAPVITEEPKEHSKLNEVLVTGLFIAVALAAGITVYKKQKRK